MIAYIKFQFQCSLYIPKEDSLKNQDDKLMNMAEIFNFSTIEKKSEFELQKKIN